MEEPAGGRAVAKASELPDQQASRTCVGGNPMSELTRIPCATSRRDCLSGATLRQSSVRLQWPPTSVGGHSFLLPLTLGASTLAVVNMASSPDKSIASCIPTHGATGRGPLRGGVLLIAPADEFLIGVPGPLPFGTPLGQVSRPPRRSGPASRGGRHKGRTGCFPGGPIPRD